jgi:hypothetical protein
MGERAFYLQSCCPERHLYLLEQQRYVNGLETGNISQVILVNPNNL